MVFNLANLLRDPGLPPDSRVPHGSFMVYAAADRGRAMLELDDAAIAARFADDLAAVFPAVRGKIREVLVQRWPRGLPYPHVGRAGLQSALTTPIEPLFLAGDYLGTWYTETAAQTAAAAAAGARRVVGTPWCSPGGGHPVQGRGQS
jgi:oxygen-dependent protoporphyrinogen oxidase